MPLHITMNEIYSKHNFLQVYSVKKMFSKKIWKPLEIHFLYFFALQYRIHGEWKDVTLLISNTHEVVNSHPTKKKILFHCNPMASRPFIVFYYFYRSQLQEQKKFKQILNWF